MCTDTLFKQYVDILMCTYIIWIAYVDIYQYVFL